MHKNRVVVVTGAAGGIGSLIAARFIANGDTVIATDTSDEELSALSRRLHKPANLYTASADVSDQASCSRLAEFATEKARRVDVLVNCAGFFPTLEFDEMTLDQWNRVIGINLTVNVVTPGLTLTPKAKETLPKELIDKQMQTRAIPRDEKGEDLVGAVFFLASPDSDFISGQTINVDGGRHML